MAKNVFLSFAMEDKTLVELFRGQAKNRNNDLEFNDHSVKEPFENAWKTNVKAKINRCTVVICLIGSNTWRSDAVNWEIEESLRQGKKIFGVRLNDNSWVYPTAITNNRINVVGWNLEQIMKEV